ncbi:hypothetical protein SAMN05443575_2855 [Jatrophihabitans endophyticus]|uniref:Uncharacterized protein n=1 Tax=Jatrophihabitans endophyticus TaxID=1206085 RepID=A0A1M5MX16_9ACTN|nr:hypothetical protein [Jatrophihabitans endophyticus]SHG81876.1 hypothetical protein SAMN05443575_2855 [Jatrophihabitans endophyticus]
MTTADAVARCCGIGAVAGLVSGAAVGTMVFPLFGTVCGAGYGVVVGLVLGLVESAVLVPLAAAGAGLGVLRAAGAATAAAGMAAFAHGVADVTGRSLVGLLVLAAGVGAALTRRAVRPQAANVPFTSPIARVAAVVVTVATVIGTVTGALIGMRVDRSAAWFAAVEGLLAGAVVGLHGAAVVTLVMLGRERRHRAPRSGRATTAPRR